MPIFGLFLMFQITSGNINFEYPEQNKLWLYILMFLLTALIPMISIFILMNNNMISSMELEKREERIAPFLLTLLYYFLAYFLLRKAHLPDVFYSAFIGSWIALLLSVIITFNWKISIHMVGIGGVTGTVAALFEIPSIEIDISILLGLILLMGLVGTARLALNAHKSEQVYVGALVGFLCEFLIIKSGIVL
jgi:hypothetical protein